LNSELELPKRPAQATKGREISFDCFDEKTAKLIMSGGDELKILHHTQVALKNMDDLGYIRVRRTKELPNEYLFKTRENLYVAFRVTAGGVVQLGDLSPTVYWEQID